MRPSNTVSVHLALRNEPLGFR